MKQGVVIIPVLFRSYPDELLGKVGEAGVRCCIGNIFIGALALADNIVLLARTARTMRLLLGICDHYAPEYLILFNAKQNLNVLQLTHVMAIQLLS